MKLKRRELKTLIESFISGEFGTMEVIDPYEKLHPAIKDKFRVRGSQQDPPISSREYFLKFKNDPDMLAQIANLSDSLYSEDQPYEYGDDDALEPPTGEQVSKQIDTFEDPFGEYYSFKTVLEYFKSKIPDLVMQSRAPHPSYMSGPGKTYTRSHKFFSEDKNGLIQLKKALHSGGFRIINDEPQFSGEGGIFTVNMASKKYNIPESLVGKFAFVALEPEKSN